MINSEQDSKTSAHDNSALNVISSFVEWDFGIVVSAEKCNKAFHEDKNSNKILFIHKRILALCRAEDERGRIKCENLICIKENLSLKIKFLATLCPSIRMKKSSLEYGGGESTQNMFQASTYLLYSSIVTRIFSRTLVIKLPSSADCQECFKP